MSDLFGYVAQVFSFPPESLGEVVQERLIQLQISNLNDIFLKYSEKNSIFKTTRCKYTKLLIGIFRMLLLRYISTNQGYDQFPFKIK